MIYFVLKLILFLLFYQCIDEAKFRDFWMLDNEAGMTFFDIFCRMAIYNGLQRELFAKNKKRKTRKGRYLYDIS
ncbi:hypothetical protein D0T49_11205 [Paludibacter sp. 221]|nr:hypothetical protein [Paludibacter sp. 221]